MPKQENWSQYFSKLNKTLSNFESRIEKLEYQIKKLAYSKNIEQDSRQAARDTEQVFESSPKRRLGWLFIWLALFFWIGPFIFYPLGYLLPYGTGNFLVLCLIVAGIIMILRNPKTARVVEVEKRKEIDLGQDSLLTPAEGRIAKADLKSAKADIKSAKTAQSKPKEKSNLESDIGKKWLPRIGIISIVLGIAFFIIYAIQNRWIGPTGQVALGVLIGILMILAGGFFYRKEYLGYSMYLTGGGFAIVYFAVFAANRFYGLINVYTGVFFLSLVIAGAILFSVKRDSKIIASEAFLLGYIVPLLTSQVNMFFLIYSIALTIGLAVLISIKQWKLLGACGIIAMYVTHLFWLDYYKGKNQDILHILFLLVYFVIFAFMAIKTKNSMKEEVDSWISSKGIFGLVFIVTYLMLFLLSFENSTIIVSSLILMSFAAGFFVMNFEWDFFLIFSMIGTYLMHLVWMTKNLGINDVSFNFISVTVYFILFNLLIYRLKDRKQKTTNVISLLANSFVYYAFVIWPLVEFSINAKGIFTAGLAIFYLIMAYVTYGKKAEHFFSTYLVLCLGYLALTIPLQFNKEWITLSWAAMTLMMVLLSFKLEDNTIRVSSTVMAGFTLGKLLFIDSWKLGAVNFQNFADSTRLFAFVGVIIVFYLISYIYYSKKELFENYGGYIMYINGAYTIAATGLTALLIWIEIWDTNLAINAKKLWTSLAFILQAIFILAFGFGAKIKLFRVMGLILFGVAILKVFLYDLSNLETGYRIISFIVLGVLALAGAFLYNKYKEYL